MNCAKMLLTSSFFCCSGSNSPSLHYSSAGWSMDDRSIVGFNEIIRSHSNWGHLSTQFGRSSSHIQLFNLVHRKTFCCSAISSTSSLGFLDQKQQQQQLMQQLTRENSLKWPECICHHSIIDWYLSLLLLTRVSSRVAGSAAWLDALTAVQ